MDNPVLMTVEEDIGLNDIVLTHATTLVGHFNGRKFNSVGVKNWVYVTWKEHVGLCPEVFLLHRGWITFKFVLEGHAATVLNGVWQWDNVGLFLKRWSPLFNPRCERYDLLPNWVKLPKLPFEFWSVDFFKLVGNTLGSHLETDLSFLDTGVCCLGRVLVLLDLRHGLAADLVIKWGDIEFCQPLDYLGLPFRCNRCHAYGHLIPNCSFPF